MCFAYATLMGTSYTYIYLLMQLLVLLYTATCMVREQQLPFTLVVAYTYSSACAPVGGKEVIPISSYSYIALHEELPAMFDYIFLVMRTS